MCGHSSGIGPLLWHTKKIWLKKTRKKEIGKKQQHPGPVTQWSNQNASRGNCSSTPGSPGELAHKPARDPLFGVCILVLLASGRVPQNFPLATGKKGQRGKEKTEERPTALCSTDPAVSEHRSRNTPEAQLRGGHGMVSLRPQRELRICKGCFPSICPARAPGT